jgi:MFS family permease
MDPNAQGPMKMTGTAWLICVIASIGFAFDIYVLLILPLIIGPAIGELTGAKLGSPEYIHWARMLFFLPAFAGGILGLLGGYLTDRLGRRRILTFSILLYALSALASAFVSSIQALLILRCLTFMGVCVEFVAAVAWLAELFQEPKQREKVLGYTQAFSSIGGLLVTAAYFIAVQYKDSFPPINGAHEPWRYALLSGVLPAIPLIIIRPFLPESPVWKKKKEEGTLKRPSFAQLFSPELCRTTIVTTLIFACSYGAAFGAIQHLPQIVPGLPEVRDLAKPAQQKIVSGVQFCQEIGGLVGRFLLAWLAVHVVSRQRLLRFFQIPGVILVPLVFFFPATQNLQLLKVGVFVAGMLTVAQFSFWGNYLPRVYPVHLRGTGESFAANVGGRILGTSAAWVTISVAGSAWLKSLLPKAAPAVKFAYTAGTVALLVYAVGLVASYFLPEPGKETESA